MGMETKPLPLPGKIIEYFNRVLVLMRPAAKGSRYEMDFFEASLAVISKFYE